MQDPKPNHDFAEIDDLDSCDHLSGRLGMR